MTDEELEAIVDEIAAAGGMGDMGVGTIYGDLALDVAKAVRERCAALITTGDYCRYVDHNNGTCDCADMAAAIRSVA